MKAPESQAPTPVTHGAEAGIKVYVDPETGELTARPRLEQVRQLSAAFEATLSHDSEDLVPFFLRDGGTGVYLEGRFQSATVVRVRPDGSLEIQCADHPQAVRELLHDPSDAPAEPSAPLR